MPSEDEGRDGHDTAASRGVPKLASHPLRERDKEQITLTAPSRSQPADPLMFSF